jgi:signal transduction histidine kinase
MGARQQQVADGNAERRRGRERLLFGCAIAILLFAPADWLSMASFSWGPVIIRLEWAGALVATALGLRRADARRTRGLLNLLAIATAALFAALVQQTGGAASPLFAWSMALPAIVALVVQGHAGAVIACGATLIPCGVAILGVRSTSPAVLTQWTLQLLAVTGFAYYASATYRRALERERTQPQPQPQPQSPSQPPSHRQPVEDVSAARLRASEAALAARDEFLAVAAHELRTPLTSLLLHIEAIERSMPAPPPSAPAIASWSGPQGDQRRIAAVARQARRLSGLIDGMLDVSRFTGGHLSLELAQVDIAALAREVAQRFAPDAAAAACPLSLRLDAPLVALLDANRMDQIITNLIGNAIKYGAGAPIEISGEGDAASVRLTVRDHGIGISPADQERIFQRFERAADERQYSGAGLGLWITSELVKALGGRITVHSTPGAGAAFTVVLPRRPTTVIERRGAQRQRSTA